MKRPCFNLPAIACLSFVFSFIASGCTSVAYKPTQDNIPKMSYSEASKKLMVLKGNRLHTKNHYYNIADVKISSDRVDIIFKKRDFFNRETGETDKQTFYLKSLGVPSVVKEPNNLYYLSFPDHRMFLFRNQDDAISCANAFFILKRRAEGYRPPVDAAAEAAFQKEARNYREAAVKPVLPEEAHKYSVQGDFAAEKKNLPVAVDLYADALKISPWWPEGHFKRGLILADLEQYDEAIAEMKKFLLLAPDSKEARPAQDNIYKWESAASWSSPTTTVPASGTGTVTGMVTRFEPINPLWYGSDVWSKIEAVADTGDKFDFIVFKSTLIYDTDGKEISTIKKDKRAEIKYSLITDGNNRTNGKNKAISIRYLE